MTLTREQFDKLYSKGLSIEQIKAFDAGQTPETMQPKKTGGFFESVVKEPINALVVRPATRLGNVLGAAGVYAFGNEKQKEKADRLLKSDTKVDVPFLGKYDVKVVADTPQAAGRQIIGETAETASYLYGGGTAGSVVRKTLGGKVIQGAVAGSRAGAVGGGLYSFGQAAQEAEMQASDVAYQTMFGTAVGGALGLTIGAATPIVIKSAGAIRRFKNIGAVNEKLYELNSTTLRPSSKQTQEWAEKGVDPIKTYTEIFATDIPKVDKTNRFIPESAQEFAGKVDTLYKTGAQGFNTILRNSPETNSLRSMEQAALARNRSANLTALQKEQAEMKIVGEFQALRREYAGQLIDGDRLPVAVSDTIKDRFWSATKYFGPEEASVANEANRAIARSFAEGIEEVITDVNVKGYNKELQRLIVLRDYIESLGGKLAGTGGKMTRLMSRVVGGIAGASGGPAGTVVGMITGDKVAQVMMNPQNSPMRWLILKRLQQLPVAQRKTILEEADRIIQEMMERQSQMLQLPAPSSIPMGPKMGETGVRVYEAKKSFGKDPKTGRFFRTYTSENGNSINPR